MEGILQNEGCVAKRVGVPGIWAIVLALTNSSDGDDDSSLVPRKELQNDLYYADPAFPLNVFDSEVPVNRLDPP